MKYKENNTQIQREDKETDLFLNFNISRGILSLKNKMKINIQIILKKEPT